MSGRELTHELIGQIVSGERGAQLRAELRRMHVRLTADEREDAFQQACTEAARNCHGQSEGEVFMWLRMAADRRMIDIQRRRPRRDVPVGIGLRFFESFAGSSRGMDDELIAAEDEAEVERVSRSVIAQLSDSQREVVALYTRGRRRPQIAETLGLTPRTVKRQLERALRIGRVELIALAGHGCDEGEELISRYAFGLASPREVRQAHMHLLSCRQCGRMYERLDLWRERVAALLPLPPVAAAAPSFGERLAQSASEAVGRFKDQGAEAGETARQHLAGVATQAKQHATAAYYRAVDPTPLAGVRPGAAAAVLASCVAVGTGATYCLKQGVGPIPGIGSERAWRQADKEPGPKLADKANDTLPAPPIVTPPPDPPSTPLEQPAPQPPTEPPLPPPIKEEEYEPIQARAAAASTSSASSDRDSPPPSAVPPAESSEPAPAPADDTGEFAP